VAEQDHARRVCTRLGGEPVDEGHDEADIVHSRPGVSRERPVGWVARSLDVRDEEPLALGLHGELARHLELRRGRGVPVEADRERSPLGVGACRHVEADLALGAVHLEHLHGRPVRKRRDAGGGAGRG
jgi:hypothetical protein